MHGCTPGGTIAHIRHVIGLVAVALLFFAGGCATMRFQALPQASKTLRPVTLEEFDGTYIAGFFSPGEDQLGNRLYLLEPYRPGAIPVVFVHGLVSDPSTWVNAHRGLRSDPELAQRYQFWAFRYETGPSYLDAAADLRAELARVRSTLDPNGTDPAMSRVVLVGHSMGGLVSQLQVTHSENHLWHAVSNTSPDQLHADSNVRDQVRRNFFFEPQPGIERLVYIATPHHGSFVATSRIGSLGQRLISFPQAMVRSYDRFQTDNERLFPNLPERPPTSVNQLRPSSPILQALTKLRFADGVTQHTILGVGQATSDWRTRDGDGYVTTWSAHWPYAVSEHAICEKHTKVHKHPAAVAELRRILYEHLANPHLDPPNGIASRDQQSVSELRLPMTAVTTTPTHDAAGVVVR